MGGFGGFTGGGGEMGGGFMAEEKNAGRSEQKVRKTSSSCPLSHLLSVKITSYHILLILVS